jgi:hypothetical protein
MVAKQFIFNWSYDRQMKSGKEAESEKELKTEARKKELLFGKEYKHNKEREDSLLFVEKTERKIR